MSLTITKLGTGKLEVTGATNTYQIDGTAILRQTESGISFADILGNRSVVAYDDDNINGVQFVVDANGNPKQITDTESLFNAVKILLDAGSLNELYGIDKDGNNVAVPVTTDGHLKVEIPEYVLNDILVELKLIRMHHEIMTGEIFKETDIKQ